MVLKHNLIFLLLNKERVQTNYMQLNNKKIILVGAGPMAIEYCKVLKNLDISFDIIGRGNTSAEKFYALTGKMPFIGGIDNFFKEKSEQSNYEKAIIAVNERELGNATRDMMRYGIKEILVEKPGALDFNDLKSLNINAENYKTKVYVGYNRRFYSSVIHAIQIIENDGGVTSFNFEFTEWGHIISEIKKEEGVKENWLLHNSTHVIDLAFFVGGKPREIKCYKNGYLDWHPKGSIFCGAGVSELGALFSYQANWNAPGRWSVEFLTKNHRLILRPLEKLQIQKIGSIAIEEVKINNELDIEFKPGLYLQTKTFLQNPSNLLSLQEQIENGKSYLEILLG